MVREAWKGIPFKDSEWMTAGATRPGALLREALRATFSPLRSEEQTVLRGILGIDLLERELHELRERLVAEARTQGSTWAEIGAVLDVGNTAAQKRFGAGLSPETAARVAAELEEVRTADLTGATQPPHSGVAEAGSLTAHHSVTSTVAEDAPFDDTPVDELYAFDVVDDQVLEMVTELLAYIGNGWVKPHRATTGAELLRAVRSWRTAATEKEERQPLRQYWKHRRALEDLAKQLWQSGPPGTWRDK